MKVNSLKRNQSDFPLPLCDIPSPPAQIFYAGSPPASWLDKPRVAIVGSRKVSSYGRDATEKIAGELAQAGVVVISGLAYGVDSIAHRAALSAGGLTVAVLPTDIEHIYPAAHHNLAKQIIEQGGSLISEYPSGSVAYKQNFIARNRLVSGLTDVLLITEAAINSGSLHTANFALEQGKTVMAVPGNIFSPNSQGTNNLIKSGALPALSAEDVFFALGIETPKQTRSFHGSPSEKKVLETIRSGLANQEEISLELNLSPQELNRLLTGLEINGYIKPTGSGFWSAV